MTRKYFGTDGVRGTVGETPMTPDFVLRLGYAAGRVLSGQSKDPAVVIGKDTRIPGYMIESALGPGLSGGGRRGRLGAARPAPPARHPPRARRPSARGVA